MKKLIFSLVLIGLGSVLWWTLSNTARFSINKWDGKFEAVLKYGLEEAGLTDGDVVASVHEVHQGGDGQWVTHHLTIPMIEPLEREKLKMVLERAGADVEETISNQSPIFLVSRGRRVYQKITFLAAKGPRI